MRNLLAAMVAVAIAFVVVLGVGFRIQESIREIPATLFGLTAGIGIALIAGAIYCLLAGISPWASVARQIRRIGNRPAKRHAPVPAQRIDRRSAAQIAYDENPDATASCAHLQPIERAMRLAGVDVHLQDF